MRVQRACLLPAVRVRHDRRQNPEALIDATFGLLVRIEKREDALGCAGPKLARFLPQLDAPGSL